MKFKKLGVILAACSLLLQVPVFAGEVQGENSSNVGIYVNGGLKIEYKSPCFIKNGVVYAPLRETIENYGGTIEYKKPNIIIIFSFRIIEMNPSIIEMNPTKKEFTINGLEKSFEHMPEIVNGVTYMSIEDINSIDNNYYKIENKIGEDGEHKVFLRMENISKKPKASMDNDYSFDLKLLKEFSKNDNSVVSPISLKVVLAMTANGTTGETKKQILDVLNIKDLNDFNNKIKYADKGRYNSAKWVTSNSIWANEELLPEGVTWNNDFTNILKENYYGVSDSIKGSSDIDKINSWISNNTNGLIRDAVKETNFELMLMNTSYFKGSWVNAFNERNTKKGTFYNKDGSEAYADFMGRTEMNYFYEEEGLKALTMEYGDICYEYTPYDMTFIMTDKEIDSETLNRIFKYQDKMEVNVKLPKFKIENGEDCIQMLKNMGIEDLFDASKADLTPMVNEAGYYIDKVVQNAVISIDEKGTEAAALSTDSATRGVHEEIPPEFIADHPFYFFLRNNQTGDILFEGYFSSAE
ncbi:MAG: serpin family protein [Lachnospiraceae bacterium]|nr:serpin family protein [Lachnospiraceae bacterium]